MAATIAPASDIRTRLDDCVSGILAMPHAVALANVSALEMAVEFGRHLERQALGIAPPPPPQRRLFLVPSARPS